MSKLQAPLRSEFSNPDAEMIPPKTAGNPSGRIAHAPQVDQNCRVDCQTFAIPNPSLAPARPPNCVHNWLVEIVRKRIVIP